MAYSEGDLIRLSRCTPLGTDKVMTLLSMGMPTLQIMLCCAAAKANGADPYSYCLRIYHLSKQGRSPIN